MEEELRIRKANRNNKPNEMTKKSEMKDNEEIIKALEEKLKRRNINPKTKAARAEAEKRKRAAANKK